MGTGEEKRCQPARRVEPWALKEKTNRLGMLKRFGLHRLHWSGRDDQGRPLASGVYVYRLVTAGNVQTRKLTLLR